MSFFSFLGIGSSDTTLPDLFPIPIAEKIFVQIDVQNIYTRILTDVMERTQGLPEDKQKLLWDSCTKDQSTDGVITMLAKAMTDQKELFIVFKNDVVREANQEEREQIKADYEARAESKVGVYVTFKKYAKSDMIKFYSALEYCSVGGLYKQQNLSHAIQIRVAQLRASLGNADSERAIIDAKAIAEGLKSGRSVMTDKDDVIETARPDLTAIEKTMEFIEKQKSFYLGLPASWVSGQLKAALGDTGQADAKAIDRGLKPYFFSVMKPVIDSLFGLSVEFKPEDNENIGVANDTLTTFEATSDGFVSAENKTKILNKLYSLPANSKGDPVPEVDPNAVNNEIVPGKNSAPPPKQADPEVKK